MADIDLANVVDMLSKLQFCYSSLAKSWYDVFYNSEPKDVQVEFYDTEGEAHTYIVPNRAKDKSYITNGAGSPEGSVPGKIGSLYLNTATGAAYIKSSDDGGTSGWVKLVGTNSEDNVLDTLISRGSGSPEGVLVGFIGQVYIDTDDGSMYIKRTSTSTSGWYRVDSYPTAQLKEEFEITESTNQIKLSGRCEDPALLSIYVDGVLLSPKSYSMPLGDYKTIALTTPIVVPETEDSANIVCIYFDDIHFAKSQTEQALVDLAADMRKFVYGTEANYESFDEIPEEDRHSVKWYYDEMMAKSISVEKEIQQIDIKKEQSIEAVQAKYEECQAQLDHTLDDLTDFVNTKEESFSETALQVLQAAGELSDTIPVVTQLREDCTNLANRTQANADYVAQYVDDFALKSDEEAHREEVRADLDEMNNRLVNTESALYSTISSTRATLQANINSESTTRSQQISEIRTTVTDFQSNVNSYIDSHQDLGAFTNNAGYVTKTNFPIDNNGIYHFNKNQAVAQAITITVGKDCTYYTVDLGKYMEQEAGGAPIGNTNFDFTIQADKASIDTLILAKLKEAGEALDIDNMVVSFRCYFKNESMFTPSVDWDFRKISWLGEEPELEAGKSYIIEFISHDMLNTWQAHVLGICQPAIVVDTFTSTFTISCPALAEEGEQQAYLTISMVIDGREVVLDEEYVYDVTKPSMTVAIEIDKKYAGSEITAFNLRADNTEDFVRYVSSAIEQQPLLIEENKSYSITCDKKTVDTNHSFVLTVRSTAIEAYMEENELSELEVDSKFVFDWGYTSEPVTGQTYYYDKNMPGDNGVVYTFTVADKVLLDPLAGEGENNRVGNVKVRYDALGTDEEGTELCYTSNEIVDVITDGANVLTVGTLAAW